MTKADKLKAWALSQVGSPYVMGGTGQRCTPAYRRARAEQYPASAAAIRRNCPVMSGKQSSCGGCKYDGKPCYDCAQLVRRGCAAAGIEGVNISGATSQWRKGDWLRKGGVEDAPSGKMCILFREDKPGTMGHLGIALGDGTIVHASGHDTGVVRTAISAGRWTHYAIPKGMDVVVDGGEDAPSDGAHGGSTGTDQCDTIRKGAKGPTVVEAQGLLLRAGYGLPVHGADGSYGAETEAAVKAFQRAHGLTADGIMGPLTWAALDRAAQPKPSSRPTLRRGNRGNAVVDVQLALRDRGFDLEPDGIFGSITQECVKTFQGTRGLKADGVVGPMTWAALNGKEGGRKAD